MKKLLLALLITLWSGSAWAIVYSGVCVERCATQQNLSGDKLTDLFMLGGLTFYKDYTALPTGLVTAADLNATANGDGTATFTVTRSASAPATYISDVGLIQTTTTSNLPRIEGGYYDNIGFHAKKYLLIERSKANLVPVSAAITGATWTAANVTASDAEAVTSPNGVATTSSITATSANGTLLLTTAVTAQTYSVFIKAKNVTGAIEITANGGTTWVPITPISGWARFEVTAASASQKCGIRIVNSGDSVYVWGNQFETLEYASSYIPTTGSSLTRGAEVLKYNIARNRGASNESIAITYTSMFAGSEAASGNYLLDTDTKQRILYIPASNNSLSFFPNFTDSVAALLVASYETNKFSTNTAIITMNNSNIDPNTILYEGSLREDDDNTNFTTNAWGTYFYIGSSSSGANQFDGGIENIAFYQTTKDATEVSRAATILRQTGETITVAQDGSGDYLTVQSGYDASKSSASVPSTILIKAGTYLENTVVGANQHLIITGTNRDNCIIKTTLGEYPGGPMRLLNNAVISNLTLINNHDDDVGTPINDLKGYAIHDDQPKKGTTSVTNCKLQSYQQAAYGFGFSPDQIKTITSSILESYTPEASSWSDYGALFGHNSTTSGGNLAKFTVSNSTITSQFNSSVYVGDVNESLGDGLGNTATVTFIGNTLYSQELGTTDIVNTDATTTGNFSGCINLVGSSGNNVAQVNN